MTRIASVLAVLLGLSQPAAAQDITPIAGSAMVDTSAATIDAMAMEMDLNGDSRISPIEMEMAGKDIFVSMDADDDSVLSRQEMIDWPHGLGGLAKFRGREAEFAQAVTTVFDLMDTDRDIAINRAEHSAGLALAWRLADRNQDGRLSLTEFREDFIVITALRRGVGSATGR